MTRRQLQSLARQHGTPVVLIDHDIIRENYAAFKKHLPKVQAYFAVKANAEPAIVRTLYKAGASFDVASLPEFMLVYENIRHLPAKEQQDFIWDKIIYANPTKPKETLVALDQTVRAACRRGAAAARAQYRVDGRALLKIRLPSG
jgi:ornithine decarboxylase